MQCIVQFVFLNNDFGLYLGIKGVGTAPTFSVFLAEAYLSLPPAPVPQHDTHI